MFTFQKNLQFLLGPQKKRSHDHEVIVMDGGMGTALFNNGVEKSDVVWSAIALIKPEYNDKVIKCHMDYIEHGATEITTNNYAVMPAYYMKYYGEENYQDKIAEHTVLAAQLSRIAVQNCANSKWLTRNSWRKKKVFINGCIPPCVESLRPDLTNPWLRDPKNWEIATNYYRQISTVLEPFVDGFLLETVNSLLELKCMLNAMNHVRKPISISMQGAFLDEITMEAHPERCEEAVRYVLEQADKGVFQIRMFSLNCAHPDHIEESLLSLTPESRQRLIDHGIKLGCYANSVVKEAWDPKNKFSLENVRRRDRKIKSNYVHYALRWKSLGVECIGGCCGVGSVEIGNVANYFNCPPARARDSSDMSMELLNPVQEGYLQSQQPRQGYGFVKTKTSGTLKKEKISSKL